MLFRKKNYKEYEFDAEFEDHPIGNQKIYRLHYVQYHRAGETHFVGVINWPFEPFTFPEGMSREDGFKVLSYLTDYIEKELCLEPCSYQSVMALNDVLNLKRLGFQRIDKNQVNEEDVLSLYTVDGRQLLFKKSKHYEKYFEWYREGITFDEVKSIYEKCHIDFYDLVRIPNQEENDNDIQLVRKQ